MLALPCAQAPDHRLAGQRGAVMTVVSAMAWAVARRRAVSVTPEAAISGFGLGPPAVQQGVVKGGTSLKCQ